MASLNDRPLWLYCNKNTITLDAGALCEAEFPTIIGGQLFETFPINRCCTSLNIWLGFLILLRQFRGSADLRTRVANFLLERNAVNLDAQDAYHDPYEVIKFLEPVWKNICSNRSLVVQVQGQDLIPYSIGQGEEMRVILQYHAEHYRWVVPASEIQAMVSQIGMIMVEVSDANSFPKYLFHPDHHRLVELIATQLNYPVNLRLDECEGNHFTLASLLKNIRFLLITVTSEEDINISLLFNPQTYGDVLGYVYELHDNRRLPHTWLVEKSDEIYFPFVRQAV